MTSLETPRRADQHRIRSVLWSFPGVVWGLIRRVRLPLRTYRWLTVATAFSLWMLIVLGGIVRVTGSGQGCGASWPLCNGSWLPALEPAALIEWNHRLFAVLTGWLALAAVLATLLWYRRPRRLLWLALLGGVTFVGQALLGAFTVWLRLDHRWVAAHMGNSMLLLAAFILLALFARTGVPASRPHGGRIWWLALGTVGWTYLAMFTGSAVIGYDANLACPSWPHCSGAQLVPVEWPQWVSFGHRIAVGFSDVLMLVLGALIWRTRRDDRRLMLATHGLAVLYVSQVFLGAFTVWYGAPPVLKGAHLALAALTWAALVVLAAFIRLGPAPVGTPPPEGEPERSRRERPRPLRRALGRLVPENVRPYIGLMKPRIIPLLLVPTVASMLIAAVEHPPEVSLLPLILWTMLGGTLATGGAHAINQYLERDLDARMRRTRARAVVTGRVAPRNALGFGIALSVLALVQLWVTVNPLAALLAIAGNLFYVVVYTIWLKRTTVQNIVIGGAAGAVPPLVGWAAVTGDVGLPAILFFAIIFFWTPAHFWSLALVRTEDYRAAGIPMLPVVRGEAATTRGIRNYALALLVVTLLPVLTQSLGLLYLLTALGLGIVFVVRAVRLVRAQTTAGAWGLFMYSNTYLALLYLAMVVDRLLALGGVTLG